MACAVTVEVASTGKNSSVGMADSEKTSTILKLTLEAKLNQELR